MRVAVTGSVATDHLMTFPGRFSEALLADNIGKVSLSFLVDELVMRRGGVAANIAFGMAALGLRPVLVAAVGDDFDDYRSWLDRHGVDTSGVVVSEIAHTARFLCTTDLEQNQIASFYPGAMSEAREIELAPVAARLGGLDLVVVSPNDPAAMLRHTEECRQRGIPFAADPSQQLTSLDGDDIRRLVEGAQYLFANEYESALLAEKTGWTDADIDGRVAVLVTTHGADGISIRSGEGELRVQAAPPERIVDPTGVGDGFRAGFLTGRARGLSLERSAQVGAMLATYVLEADGAQEYAFDADGFSRRLASVYGAGAAEALATATA